MTQGVGRLIAVGLVVSATMSTSGVTSAETTPGGADVAVAKRVVFERALAAAHLRALPGAAVVETVPLRREHCRAYPEQIAASPTLADACRGGTFGSHGADHHCLAAAGLFTNDLLFGFYTAAMGFFVTCFDIDLALACFGVIAGVGIPPGGFGPGFAADGKCFGATTPWVSRRVQSYTGVVGVNTLLGGPEVAIFPLSY